MITDLRQNLVTSSAIAKSRCRTSVCAVFLALASDFFFVATDRFSGIERENFRLLSRMSTIMTQQHLEMYVPPCPALDKMRQRVRINRQVAGQNAVGFSFFLFFSGWTLNLLCCYQVLTQRITKVKSHYNVADWNESMIHHDSALNYLCKYPRVLAPLSNSGVWFDEEAVNRSRNHSRSHSRTASPDRFRSISASPNLSKTLFEVFYFFWFVARYRQKFFEEIHLGFGVHVFKSLSFF